MSAVANGSEEVSYADVKKHPRKCWPYDAGWVGSFEHILDGEYFLLCDDDSFKGAVVWQKVLEDVGEHNAVMEKNSNIGIMVSPEEVCTIVYPI